MIRTEMIAAHALAPQSPWRTGSSELELVLIPNACRMRPKTNTFHNLLSDGTVLRRGLDEILSAQKQMYVQPPIVQPKKCF